MATAINNETNTPYTYRKKKKQLAAMNIKKTKIIDILTLFA